MTSSTAEDAFAAGFVRASRLTWSHEEGYRFGGEPASEEQLAKDPDAAVWARRFGEREYRARVWAEYERVGPPEGMNYFEGWREFLNREEAAGKHPQWFWGGFTKTEQASA